MKLACDNSCVTVSGQIMKHQQNIVDEVETNNITNILT